MLYECHGHIILDGISYAGAVERHKNGPLESLIRQNFENCVKQGVRFYRDGGDRHGVSVLAKSIAREYGVDYCTPTFIIHKKGHYGTMFGREFEDLTEFKGLVAEAKRLGADFIKLTASGMLDFTNGGEVMGPFMMERELKEMVNISEGEGFRVMLHVNGADNIKMAVEAGVSSIEHGFWPDEAAAAAIADADIVWVPTRAAVANHIGTGKLDDLALQKILDVQERALRRAYSLGAMIASGSDSGANMVFPDRGALDENRLLAEIGIDPQKGNEKIAEIFRVL